MNLLKQKSKKNENNSLLKEVIAQGSNEEINWDSFSLQDIMLIESVKSDNFSDHEIVHETFKYYELKAEEI